MSMETRDRAANQIVANLREAIRLVEAQPTSQLQLSVFRADAIGGTVACTAGLCAMSAYFRDRGMRAHGRGWTVILGAPYMLESTPLGPVKLDEFATLNHFFGGVRSFHGGSGSAEIVRLRSVGLSDLTWNLGAVI